MPEASGHRDPFCRNGLPPIGQWPVMGPALAGLRYPPRLNCAAELLDGALAAGFADRSAIVTDTGGLTYGALDDLVRRMANVLEHDLGLVPGARVLLRSGNTPVAFAAWLAVVRSGCVAVATMPLLRAPELQQVLEFAAVDAALCSESLCEELDLAISALGSAAPRLTFADGAGELERLAARRPAEHRAADTAADDVCLLAFTSGTTGRPKACAHFHGDVLAVCDTYAAAVLRPTAEDVFAGTPPIAFTFGLGALLLFPFRFGASVALPADASPAGLLAAIPRHGVTLAFTSPTGYRAMLREGAGVDLSSLRLCVSAGEPLDPRTCLDWEARSGVRLLNGIGATELLHIFLSTRPEEQAAPGSLGRPVPGYEIELLDEAGRPVAGAGVGLARVRGPVGCRYLSDPRQAAYVVDGWNIPGDLLERSADGDYRYVARADDMIVSSGYKIAAPEVEAALLNHPAVAECAVTGAPDPLRGAVVAAFVVARPGCAPGPSLAGALQEHVKRTIAPYKYPRRVRFVDALPRTPTGKIQRARLRALAAAGGVAPIRRR